MKKYIGVCLGVMMGTLLFAAVGFAADPQTLGNVDMDFCKGGNRLAQYISTGAIDNDIKTISGLANYTIAAPKRGAMIDENGDILVGICMIFTNVGEESVDIDLGIVDGEFAYGAQAVQACKTTADGIFGKGVTFIGENTITVPAKDKIEKRAIFRIPKGFAGSVHGCITYSVSGEKDGEGTISIIDRKANLVDFIIPGILENKFGLIPISSVTDTNTQIDAYGEKAAGNELIQVRKKYDENRVNVIMGLENSGYVDEEYTVQILREGLMGFVYGETKSGTGSLYPQEKILYHQSLTGANWYDGRVNTTILVQHRPIQQGDVSPQERKTIRYTFAFLWTPIHIVVTIVVMLLLLGRGGIILIRRKFKSPVGID